MDPMYQGIADRGSEEPRFVHCDPCKYEQKTAMADTYCVDCKEHLCPQCKHFHTKFQAFRHHKLTTGFKAENKESKPLNLKLCDIHKTNEVKYYCNSHKSVICTICKASIHSSCKLDLITEVCQYEEDKNQLDLTNDTIQDLIQSFKNSLQESPNSIHVHERKTTTQHYRTKLLQIKDRFSAILDKALDDILMSERESEAKHSEESETEQVYRDAVSDLSTLSNNIEEVLKTDDTVATFSGKLKALKLREEYSLIERKMKTRSMDAPADLTKYGKLIEEMENSMMVCELYINQKQPIAGHANQQPKDHGREEDTHVATERRKQTQLQACFGRLSSATSYPDLVTATHEGKTHKQSKQAQFRKVVSNTNEDLLSMANNAENQTNNPNSRPALKTAPKQTPLNILCDEDYPKLLETKYQGVHVQPFQELNRSPGDNNINDKTENPKLYSKIVQTPVEKPVNPSFNNMKPSSMRHSIVKLPSDKKTCDITGSTFLPNGQLALCDHENMNIKLTNRAFEITHSFRLDHKPWDITATAETELAVTLPSNRTVRFLEVSEDKIVNRKKFQVKQDVWGIDSFGDLIIISLHDLEGSNGAVEIRQHNGVLIKQIKSDIFGDLFFKSPGYVLVEKQTGNIFVSDGKMNAIFCFTQDGLMIRKFEDGGLRWPKKMVADNGGNLIICSMFSDSLKVLPPNGVQYKTFVKCDGPQTVSYRETDKHIVVGRNLSDTILILKY